MEWDVFGHPPPATPLAKSRPTSRIQICHQLPPEATQSVESRYQNRKRFQALPVKGFSKCMLGEPVRCTEEFLGQVTLGNTVQ